MSKELFKTIEAQGKLITELRGQLEDIAKVSEKLIDHHYDQELRHWQESTDESLYLITGEKRPESWDKYQNHIVSKWDKLKTLINK